MQYTCTHVGLEAYQFEPIAYSADQGAVSIGITDCLMDHRPMLTVHSRMVHHKSDGPTCLLKQPPGTWQKGEGNSP